jgi:CDP-glucose 4,6-dehydratase
VQGSEFWRGRRAFVTGHTGFMGGWLCVLLKELGASVAGYALPPPTSPSFFDSVGVSALLDRHVLADVRDGAALSAAMRDSAPEVIFHLAAQPLVREAFRSPVATFDINVMGTVNVLEAARNLDGVRAIVVVTSDKVYDNREWEWDYRENDRLGGREPYGISKACAELAIDAYRHSFLATRRIGIATVRAGNIIGGGDWAPERLIPDIMRGYSKGVPVVIRNPGAIRPWQHVLEPCWGCLMLAEKLVAEAEAFSGSWNFGPAREDHRSVSWIVENCARLWGAGAKWEVDRGMQPYEAKRLAISSAKAELHLGWHPRWRIDAALERTVRWYRAAFQRSDLLQETLADVHQGIGSGDLPHVRMDAG